MMTEEPDIPLDLHDIQGNIVKAYGRENYFSARYMAYQIHDGKQGRQFIRELFPKVTNAAPWSRKASIASSNPKPTVTLNMAFTFSGLQALGLPEASLLTFPEEFMSGMVKRQDILGDDGKSAPQYWDPVWLKPIHILVWLNGPGDSAGTSQDLDTAYRELARIAGKCGPGVECLTGHRGPDGQLLDYQTASVLYDHNNFPTAKEHFGFDDGISNPFFKGTGAHRNNVIGGGKVTDKNPGTIEGWEPLETGEFILGYKDEAFEYPEAPMPPLLGRNGTYMVFRKLHQNVGSFETYIRETAKRLGVEEEFLKAKFVGRWPNGAPLATFPTKESADDFGKRYQAASAQWRNATTPEEKATAFEVYAALRTKLVAFNYDDDLAGAHCPIGAHIRRSNPRGSLEYGRTGAFETHGALTNRRRILRRGLPYGHSKDRRDDSGEHGSIIMFLCASIRRQFEFVQQQWINYGNDFKLANDKDPIIGNHCENETGGDGRMLIMSEPGSGKRPLLCGGMPRFVETRGGGYFFIPSLTALRMIGEGTIDPT